MIKPLFALPLVCGVLLAAAGCSDTPTIAVERGTVVSRKLQVELVVTEVRPLAVAGEFTGNLLPRRRSIVVSEVDGIIQEIPAVGPKIDLEVNGKRYVEQLGIGYGHEVKQNDVLVKLDPADFEFELVVAKAKAAKARADLANLQAWERSETIDGLTAGRDEAKARHEQAVAELQRAAGLGEAISQSNREARKTDVATTRAILANQEALLRKATAGPTKEELAVQQALVAQAEAEVKQKERELERATIRAPYAGVVTDMYVEVGERVTAASGQILELMDVRFLVAEVGVPEAYMNRVQVQDRATVQLAGSSEPVLGLIVGINDKLDPESRSFRVRVAIDNAERRFKAGQFARVQLNVGSAADYIVLPTRAITFVEGQPGVFVCERGVVKRRPIELGASNESHTEVMSGLAAGESVVVDDPTLLTDGMQVEVRDSVSDPN